MKRVGLSMYQKLYWLPLVTMLLMLAVVYMAQQPGGTPLDEGLAKISGTQFHEGLSKVRAAASQPAAVTFMLWCTGVWFIAGRWIALWLVPLFVSTITCPRCGDKMSTVAIWGCSCGFNDYRETNILSKRCPQCGAKTARFNCPRCATTILLW
jgi:hypothetical protein